MTDSLDTGDGLANLLLFALVTSVSVGAAFLSFRWAERLREKDEEREVGR